MQTMKTIPRRSFIKSGGGAIGLATLARAAQGAQVSENAKQNLGPRRPEALEGLLRELETTGSRFYNVPRADGEFLHLLVKMIGARRVLEIGTANGYSAIWLAMALEETGGALNTIEIQPELVRAARTHVQRAGLTHRVTFHEGDAHQLVTTLPGPFDLVFIDAEIGGKMDYFQKVYPEKLPRGGVLLCHNAIVYAAGMRDYLDHIRAHPDFDTVILSLTMEDGFCVSHRRRVADPKS